eukprot:12217547-Ditylum_brightwellii.AAC.1
MAGVRLICQGLKGKYGKQSASTRGSWQLEGQKGCPTRISIVKSATLSKGLYHLGVMSLGITTMCVETCRLCLAFRNSSTAAAAADGAGSHTKTPGLIPGYQMFFESYAPFIKSWPLLYQPSASKYSSSLGAQ